MGVVRYKKVMQDLNENTTEGVEEGFVPEVFGA
jgi:hypothetical protein